MTNYKLKKYSKEIYFERILWNIVWTILIRPFPRALASKWEIFILKLFGAKIGKDCTIYSSAKVLIPRNLIMEDGACIADHTIISNSHLFHMKKRAIFSQYSVAYCGSHNVFNEEFESQGSPIILEEFSWVASHCYIGPGVTIGRGSRVGADSAVRSSIPPYSISYGNPTRIVGFRFNISETLSFENRNFPPNMRLPKEILKNNYDKYFVKRYKEIRNYIKL